MIDATKAALAAVILATAALDSLRDAWYNNPKYHKGTPWDQWHIVKRTALYLPLATLLLVGRFSWLELAAIAIVGACAWGATMRLAGKDWPLFGAWRAVIVKIVKILR